MCVNPIEIYFDAIRKKDPGQADTRYKSWEYCHAAFLEAHKSNKPDYDYLALHLAFYLASWGMYRGSSFLLQRDYKTHIPVVEEIMKSDYDVLWDFDPKGKEECEVKKAVELIIGLKKTIINKYSPSESEEAEDSEDKTEQPQKSKEEATDTLITKILMGTFACIPAFDRFFKSGIAYLKGTSRKFSREFTEKTCNALMGAAAENDIFHHSISKECYYPPMKLMDMYLWQIGYANDSIRILKEMCERKIYPLKVNRIRSFVLQDPQEELQSSYDIAALETIKQRIEKQIKKLKKDSIFEGLLAK